jgi:hypothetical protein
MLEIMNPKKVERRLLSIAIITLLAISTIFATMPIANAKTPSYAYVAVSPDVAQVNTKIQITGWTSPVPAAGRPGTIEDRFKTGYIVTLTKPDLSTYNISIDKSYEDGTFFTSYTVDQVGSWSVTLYWPGDSNWEACTSPPFKFNVTQDAYYSKLPDVPMPTGYWTRPVPGDIKGMGSYLASWTQPGYNAGNNYYNPYSKGPNTPHVLWKTTAWSGGITGGAWGDQSAVEAYTANWNTGIIVVMGKVYFNIGPEVYCYDIYTGEKLWNKVFSGTTKFGFLLIQLMYPVTEVSTRNLCSNCRKS